MKTYYLYADSHKFPVSESLFTSYVDELSTTFLFHKVKDGHLTEYWFEPKSYCYTCRISILFGYIEEVSD